ncbi:hypothetical protein CP967_08675 [Streptomyces nitrosporeus]|uniref:Uncharacterized protein n=1 Tax=Streptomyces nitrosporeus TaxID=28894 RepID=A0A5J6F7I9_9ACTN|nr:LamG domain-containing protein [Streptomyces nitrosporeus]QEU72036.1 hypothetical protein CP967_08675 [Streptomyces nitrosporeus]GGY81089.1 hypothetical protein GCM10010327_09650 [Streptomyces nitrosporeus]
MAILVEMGWGGLVQYPWTITWTDITPRVDMVQGVTITRGASDELSETQPGTATLTLDNQDGALTPGNPDSPFFPFVRRNAPIRVSAVHYPTRTGSGPYPLSMLGDDFDAPALSSLWANAYGGAGAAGGRARIPVTPGAGAGLQSVREWTLPGSAVGVRLATLPAVNGSSSVRVNLLLDSQTAGTRLGFQYNAVAGTLRCISEVGFSDAASVDLPYSGIDHLWVRIRETSGVVYWETSGDGWDWTVRRTMATPTWAVSNVLMLSFTAARTGGTGDYVEWDYLGAVIRPRFYGTVNEWPVAWEGLASSVAISATDLFKRLNRLPPLRSCLTEEIVATGPLAYYPLTEPTGSTSAGDLSGTTAGPLSVVQLSSGGTLDLGAAPGPAAASEVLPLFTPVSATVGKYLASDLGQQFQSASGAGWNMMECWFQTTTPGRVIFGLSSATTIYQLVWSLSATGALQVESSYDGFLSSPIVYSTGNLADGQWHHLAYDEVLRQVWIDGAPLSGDHPWIVVELRKLTVGAYASGRLWAGSIGHLALYTVQPSAPIGAVLATHYEAGMTAYSGETADLRVARLARYAGVTSVTVLGALHDPVAGQGEAGGTVVSRLREVEATESGRLYAERDYFGLAYQSRDLRYNPDSGDEAFAISYADLEPGVQLADDDQKLTNSVEASRPGGATQRVVARSSILAYGLYEKQLTLLKTSDNSVVDAASWIVSRYADPEPELREVPIEAHTMPEYLDILDADISSYFTVYDLPEQATAADLRVTVEGYTETLRERSHVIQFRTSASSTDSVWVIGDPVYGILGGTSRLAY